MGGLRAFPFLQFTSSTLGAHRVVSLDQLSVGFSGHAMVTLFSSLRQLWYLCKIDD